jgi:hypothetical protein
MTDKPTIDSRLEDILRVFLNSKKLQMYANRAAYDSETAVKDLKSLLLEVVREVVGENEGTITEDGDLLPDSEERIRNQLRKELLEKL